MSNDKNATSAEENKKYYVAKLDDLLDGSLIGSKYEVLRIPHGITRLPAHCLKDADIKELILPSTLISIGYGALRGSSVESVLVRGIKKDDGSLKGSYLATDDNVAYIHTHAFDGCKNIKVFELQYVRKIYGFAFANSSLSENDLHLVDRSNVEIMDYAFGIPQEAA